MKRVTSGWPTIRELALVSRHYRAVGHSLSLGVAVPCWKTSFLVQEDTCPKCPLLLEGVICCNVGQQGEGGCAGPTEVPSPAIKVSHGVFELGVY
jgi:hypothetical protein